MRLAGWLLSPLLPPLSPIICVAAAVRRTCLGVLSHLILNDMMKVGPVPLVYTWHTVHYRQASVCIMRVLGPPPC